jgi:OOP family OmpA-OmpF porin
MTGKRLLALVPVVSLATAPLLLALSSCAGRTLEGKVGGTNTRIQDAIANGSKTIGCAPKETALAEANIKFALEALKMGEYYRGKEHAILAGKYTEIAELKTDPVRCRAPGGPTKPTQITATDRDGDGYDDDKDGCPDDPEDFDAFEDEDGCPDKDNDKDGVLDASTFESGLWVNVDLKDDVDCRNDPEDIDEFEDEDGCPDPDNDKDGLIDHPEKVDQCPNDPEDFDQFEDTDGCPDPDNDKDTILDPVDQCPIDPEDMDGEDDQDGCPDLQVKVDPCAIKLDDKVYFEFNKHNVDPKSYKLLDDVVSVMNSNPGIKIRVCGHTDSKGSDSYNKKLSQKRVDSVAKYIVEHGIAQDRIESCGFGETQPIDSNRTNEGRANNRRTEFLRTDNQAQCGTLGPCPK